MKSISNQEVNSYLQLLGILHLIIWKTYSDGMSSVESDYQLPATSDIFNTFEPYDESHPVYTFVCDLLRLACDGGFSVRVLREYADAYGKATTLTDELSSLFECAKLTLLAAFSGADQNEAVECGRQGIPASEKPTYIELQDFLFELRKSRALDV